MSYSPSALHTSSIHTGYVLYGTSMRFACYAHDKARTLRAQRTRHLSGETEATPLPAKPVHVHVVSTGYGTG